MGVLSTQPQRLVRPERTVAQPVLRSKKWNVARRLSERRSASSYVSCSRRCNTLRLCCSTEPKGSSGEEGASEKSTGVKVAVAALKFYKREISPILPGSCRFVPTCSEYSMEAYKKYGVCKGTVLTAWRLCRCNPLGPSGFDPPVWFGEHKPTMEEILARPPRTSEGIEQETTEK